MLKLGVCRPDRFFAAPPRNPASWLYYRLSRSRVSLRLLDIPANPSPADVDLFERLMPHVRLASGVYRTTFRGRFRELDRRVNALLSHELAGLPDPHIEDWAASMCLTSVEWFETMASLFPQITFEASDLEFFLVGVERRDASDAFVIEESGRLLQYEQPPWVIRIEPPESWALPVNRLWYSVARRRWKEVCDICRPPAEWSDPMAIQPVERERVTLRRLPLIHPLARRLAATDPRFQLRRHSVFDRSPRPCHVIRTMNILNRSYFSDETLLRSAGSIFESLAPGGLWIVGRTVQEAPPAHEVSIFRKGGRGFELVERMGPGSEIEPLILSAHQRNSIAESGNKRT